jgi:adenosylcobinamide-GDP ribazoletransferase
MTGEDTPAATGYAGGEAARRGLPPALRGMRAAFCFASRLPVGGFPYAERDWHWAAAHLPLVGVVVGGLSAGTLELARWLGLGPLLAASLALLASIMLTGAFHEDGLADSADGLGGAHGGKSALEIMKDSRIGAYGAIALGLSLLVRVAAVSELPSGGWFALIYVHCTARIGPVWLLASEPQLGCAHGTKVSSLFATERRHVLVAVSWGVACAALGVGTELLHWRAACAVGLALTLATAACARYFRRAVGGINGDLLGASEQVGENVAWIALLAA